MTTISPFRHAPIKIHGAVYNEVFKMLKMDEEDYQKYLLKSKRDKEKCDWIRETHVVIGSRFYPKPPYRFTKFCVEHDRFLRENEYYCPKCRSVQRCFYYATFREFIPSEEAPDELKKKYGIKDKIKLKPKP